MRSDGSKDELSEDCSTVATVGRTIILTGPIAEGVVGDFLEHLHRLSHRSGAPITIKITSTGGDVSSGFAIYDAIRTTQNKIIIEAYGEVSSIAALVFMAGDERRMSPECRWMAHQGEVSFSGELKTATNRVMEAQFNDERYIDLIAERCSKPKSLIRSAVHNEKFLGAKECLELGIAHKIIGTKS